MKQHTTFCKRVLSLILVFMLTVSLLPSASLSVSAAENYMEFLGGDGSEKSPYLIGNKTHFNNIRKYATANAHFKLLSNIQFSKVDNFSIISNFNGVLDGNGYSILDYGYEVSYDRSNIKNSIFGTIDGIVKNLTINAFVNSDSILCVSNNGYILNCTINGDIGYYDHYGSYCASFVQENKGTIDGCVNNTIISCGNGAAGIAGHNLGYINNCVNNGSAWGYFDIIGGIVSVNEGSVTNCINNGSVYYDYGSAGGIVGFNKGIISKCCNKGIASGGTEYEWGHGGVVGINHQLGVICDSYNIGYVKVKNFSPYVQEYVGMFFGKNYGDIKNCYSAQPNPKDGTYKNLFGGYNAGILSSCYFLIPDKFTVNTEYSALYNQTDSNVIGLTSEKMMYPNSFKGFNFDTNWKFDSNAEYKYPVINTLAIDKIEIISKPDNLIQTVEGVYPDISQFQFKVIYSDKTEAIINGSSIWLAELDLNKLGLQEFYPSYQGVRASEKISVKVNKKKLVSIEVKTLPKKLKYTQGQKINLSGGKLSLIYDNGTSQEIEMTEADCYYNKNLIGKVTVRMEYNGLKTYFDITVNAKEVYSAVLNGPSKLVYIQGEELNLTDTYINVKYVSDDGFYETIQVTKDMISGYNPDVVGIQTVYVTYLNKKLSFVVRVVESPDRVFESASIINVSEQPYVVTEGMYPDLSNIMLEVKYTDGYKKQITVTQSMLADFNPNTLGTQKVYLFYNDKKTSNYITIDVIEKQITSIEVKRTPDKIEYVQGQSLDLTGGAITVLYNNNTTKTVEMKEATPYYNRTLIGYITVRLNFKEFNTYIQIKVNEKSVSKMTLSKPKKTEYIAGEKLDLSGLYLDVVYVSNDNYGEKIEVTPEMISGYDPNKTGAQQVTVTYLNMQATFEVNVIANTIIGDIDCDGSLNINDATVLQRYIAELITLTPQSIAVADVNNDGNININDVTAIQTILVKG